MSTREREIFHEMQAALRDAMRLQSPEPSYQRPLSALGQWPESVCAENRHEYYAGKDAAVPTADKPDF